MFKQIIKALGLVKDFSDAREWLGKRWWTSKNLWFNTVALIALILQMRYGFVFGVEEQAAVIALVNMVIRKFTGQPLVTRKDQIIEVSRVDNMDAGVNGN